MKEVNSRICRICRNRFMTLTKKLICYRCSYIRYKRNPLISEDTYGIGIIKESK